MSNADAQTRNSLVERALANPRVQRVIESKFQTFLQGMPAVDRPIGEVETRKVKFIFVSGMIAGAEDFRDYLLRIKRP